ncbi:MAG TPA: sigma-70 family RNA polymerase sigma factor [Ktedonobacterales bacterium]
MSEITDKVSTQALVARAKAGDLEAFNRLVIQYQDAIFGAAYALLGNAQDAQDVAQETFLRAWRDLASLREPEKFPAWLYRIAQNLAKNHLTRQRRPVASLEQMEWAAESEIPAPPDAATALVQEAIGTLSDVNRQAAVLFYMNGYHVEEVAALLGVPAGTVKRRLHDARNHLRQQMEGWVQQSLRQHRPSRDDRFALQIALFNAVWTGETARARALLKQAPGLIESQNSEGWTPLHFAAERGHQQMVELLLEHNADLNAAERAWGWTPLHLAAQRGHAGIEALLAGRGAVLNIVAAAALGRAEQVERLLQADASLVDEWGYGSGPLHWAAGAGHRQVVETLLAYGANVNARSNNSFSNTALHCAVLHAHIPIVELLLTAGARADVVDGYGGTPLHAVAKYPKAERTRDDAQVIDLLLAAGARIDEVNTVGETALHWAATRGQKSVGDILLAKGARLDIYSAAGLGRLEEITAFLRADRLLLERPGPGGLRSLHFAAYGNALAGAERLLASGAEINAGGGWFDGTALHLAAYQGHREMVEALLAAGADVHARDGEGCTPLHQFRFPWWTPKSDRAALATALLLAGAEVNATNGQGATPLHQAAQAGDAAVVVVLLAHGADTRARDNQGRTAQDCAAAGLHYAVLDLLDQQRAAAPARR